MQKVLVSTLILIVILIGSPLTAEIPADLELKADVVAVDCDAGESLQEAFAAKPNKNSLQVWFTGVCEESVIINRNDTLLRGFGADASQIVGQLVIEGVSNVQVRNLVVRDTPPPVNLFFRDGDGLRVISSQDVDLIGVTVQDVGGRGVSIEDSAATMRNVIVRRSVGVAVIGTASQVNVFERLETTDSQTSGICIAFAAHFFFRPGAVVEVRRNPVGIISEQNSAATLAVETELTFDENFIGILVAGQGVISFSDTNLSASNNLGVGLLAGENSNFIAFGGSNPTIKINNNALGGVQALVGGIVNLGVGTEVIGNQGPGVIADDSIVSFEGAVIRDNFGADVVASFGASLNSTEGNEIGAPVLCDDSVRARGPVGCEAAIPAANKALEPMDLYRRVKKFLAERGI